MTRTGARTRLAAAAAAVGLSAALAAGGSGTAAANTAHWRALRPAPTKRAEAAAARIGKRIYVTAGFVASMPSPRLDVYNIRTNRWSVAAPSPVKINHTAAVTHDGKLYLVDGYMGDYPTFTRGDGLAVAILLEYDPARNRWRELAPPPTKRGAIAAGVIGHELYVAGGWNTSSGDQSRLEIYNFKTRRWRRGPDMQFPRNHIVGTVAGGMFYAIGGHTDLFIDREVFPYVERYDPATERWERLPDLNYPRSGEGVTAVGDRVVVYGGESLASVVPSTEILNALTRRWDLLPDMLTPRHSLAGASYGRRVYAIQGCDRLRACKDDSTELEALDVAPSWSGSGWPHTTAPRLRLSLSPRRVHAGERVRFRVRVTARRGGRSRPVRRALVRFAGSAVRTDAGGRAVLVKRLRQPGRHPVRVQKRGFRSGRATVWVVARRALGS
jgi:N-acetylneuraminic acid mutarotase